MNKTFLFSFYILFILSSCYQSNSSVSNKTVESAETNEMDELYMDEFHVQEVEVSNEIKFTLAYIWDYEWEYGEEYEAYQDDAIDNNGEVWAFYEPELQYWLLSKESSFGIWGEMNDWVLCKPDGTYILQSVDEHGKKSLTEVKIEFQTPEELNEHYTPTGKTKTFVYELFDNITFIGKEYRKTFEKTSDETFVYLADSEINFAPIYNFNELNKNMEIRLPFYFPYELPANKLMLEETTDLPYGKGKVVLRSITPTEYYIYPDLTAVIKVDLN